MEDVLTQVYTGSQALWAPLLIIIYYYIFLGEQLTRNYRPCRIADSFKPYFSQEHYINMRVRDNLESLHVK